MITQNIGIRDKCGHDFYFSKLDVITPSYISNHCLNVCVFPGKLFFSLHVNHWGTGILIRGQDMEESVYFEVAEQVGDKVETRSLVAL